LAGAAAIAVAVLSCSRAQPASAAAPAPGWEITSTTLPMELKPLGSGVVVVQPLNIGAASSSGQVTVVDTLPPGVTATEAGDVDPFNGSTATEPVIGDTRWLCAIAAGTEANSVVTCHNGPALPSITGGGGPSTSVEPQGAGHQPGIGIAVDVATQAQGVQSNRMRIEGGGAPVTVSASDPVVIGLGTPAFGLGHWDGWFSNANGTLDTQAGSVPYAFTLDFDLNTVLENENGAEELRPAGGEARDLDVALPPGIVGNPDAVVQCTREQLGSETCPKESVVGEARVLTRSVSTAVHLYDMVPPAGTPAQFAFTDEHVNAFIETGVRTGGDYGIAAEGVNSPQKEVLAVELTIWGVPADPSHNQWRVAADGGCTTAELAPGGACNLGPHPALRPLLRLPTSCGFPQPISLSVNGWQRTSLSFTEPLSFLTRGGEGSASGFTGCGALPFEPSLRATPTTSAADSPAGLHLDLHIPQPEAVTALEATGETVGSEPGLHEADLKDATIALPAGLTIDPSAADGLEACSEAQIGFTGFTEPDPASEPGVQRPQFTPGAAACPDASKLGTVEIDTPLIDHPLPGGIYLAKQGENPFGSPLALYIAVYDAATGVVVKLPGKIEADPVTGQLTVSVEQSPQLPFADVEIDLFEGSRSPLTTPPTCGTFSTASMLTPWSSPEAGDVSPSGSFAIAAAPGGGACAASAAQEPNAPTFSAGTLTPIAGISSPLVLRLDREDGSQTLGSLSVTLPPGLLGELAGVAQCPQTAIEAAEHRDGPGQGALEAAAPSCPAASEVGDAHIGTGSGAPFYVTGRAYLAGAYGGAPFSIVVIAPAVAGPFDLGVIVVRLALSIDEDTAQVTIASGPIPRMIDGSGIPTDVRSLAIDVDRPGFMLNPTSCRAMSVTGQAISAIGQPAPLADRFRVGGCNALKFAPKLTAVTRANGELVGHGASLHMALATAAGGANLRSLKLDLPQRLPARLEAIRKACTEKTFVRNPAACPKASVVGSATVHTPILAATLAGPAYLVAKGGSGTSHPGESKLEKEEAAFPDMILVLQGRGVTIDLTGALFVSAKNITSVAFRAIPDVPIRRLDLILPEGRTSILAASSGLCTKRPLRMTTAITGQNGARLKPGVTVAVSGCKKPKRRRHARRRPARGASKIS
jgi:hypothetical protein